ncbi:MAG: sigma-70 family RNA polymerase sigma factor [Deltaproteobacteria bacterium]|nr:sigma-70 family RNA polymerase sigma factor [Deltaproteobacteria bacterium]
MDASEIEGLYRRLGPFVYRRCLRLLRDPEKARDATQEVFVRVLKNCGHIRDEKGYLPYIYRIATNHCLNVIRDGRFETPAPPVEGPKTSTGPVQESSADLERILRAAETSLDRQCVEIAYMSIVDGMTQDEIADVLDLSRKTVGRKLGKFRELVGRFSNAE